MLISNKRIKQGLVFAGVFTAYKLYELYQTGSGLIVNYQKFQLSKWNADGYGKLKSIDLNIVFSIFNTQKTQIKLRGVKGVVKVKGNTVAVINPKQNFTISQGNNVFGFSVTLIGDQTLELIKEALKSGLPTFQMEITYQLPFFSYTDKWDIPPTDYLIDEIKPFLQYL